MFWWFFSISKTGNSSWANLYQSLVTLTVKKEFPDVHCAHCICSCQCAPLQWAGYSNYTTLLPSSHTSQISSSFSLISKMPVGHNVACICECKQPFVFVTRFLLSNQCTVYSLCTLGVPFHLNSFQFIFISSITKMKLLAFTFKVLPTLLRRSPTCSFINASCTYIFCPLANKLSAKIKDVFNFATVAVKTREQRF